MNTDFINGKSTIRRVLIGGSTQIPGWITFNADPATQPDILGDVRDIQGIDNDSVGVFYLSHVLEHVELSKVLATLSKLYTSLTKNGTLFISVPDLSVLTQLLSDVELDINQKIHVLRMIYGGQISPFDYHYFGYTYEILSAFLSAAGFVGIRQVKYFDIHSDTSHFTPYKGIPISLNVVCHKA